MLRRSGRDASSLSCALLLSPLTNPLWRAAPPPPPPPPGLVHARMHTHAQIQTAHHPTSGSIPLCTFRSGRSCAPRSTLPRAARDRVTEHRRCFQSAGCTKHSTRMVQSVLRSWVRREPDADACNVIITTGGTGCAQHTQAMLSRRELPVCRAKPRPATAARLTEGAAAPRATHVVKARRGMAWLDCAIDWCGGAGLRRGM